MLRILNKKGVRVERSFSGPTAKFKQLKQRRACMPRFSHKANVSRETKPRSMSYKLCKQDWTSFADHPL